MLRHLLALLLLAAAPGIAAAQESVKFPWKPGWTKEFYENQVEGALEGALFRPTGAPDKAPFVVFLHGCSGLDLPSRRHWGEFLAARGVGVLMVDSLAPRMVVNVCQEGQHWVRRRADDASSALAWLKQQPYVRPDRIAVMGQSHGGAAALFALDQGNLPGDAFVGGIALYPGCAWAVAARVRIRKSTKILIGAEDNWTPAGDCQKLIDNQLDKTQIEMIVFPEAVHAFDNPAPVRLAYNKYKLGEHPASRDKARAIVAAWIDSALKR
jgi:dienelactone hydrolase